MSGYVPDDPVGPEIEECELPRRPLSDGNTERWSSRYTVRFVKLYESYPCLWDQRKPEYKNKQMRDSAVQAIADAMGIQGFDVKGCRRKIRIIRSTYWNECAKIARSAASGTPYMPKLVWFPMADRFLSNISRLGEGHHQNWKLEQSCCSEAEYPPNEVQPTVRLKAEPVEEEPVLEDTQDNDFCCPEDEFDIFGKSVACQLRQVPLPDALQLQVQIQALISKQRMRRHQEDQRRCQDDQRNHIQNPCASVGPAIGPGPVSRGGFNSSRSDCRYQGQNHGQNQGQNHGHNQGHGQSSHDQVQGQRML